MGKDVRTTPQADLHILVVDAWWREHRDRAPDLFEQELAAIFRTISAAPGAGKVYPHPGSEEVRRYLMRSTRNHVYYVERDDHVLVVAVWGAVKGSGPDLVSIEPHR